MFEARSGLFLKKRISWIYLAIMTDTGVIIYKNKRTNFLEEEFLRSCKKKNKLFTLIMK